MRKNTIILLCIIGLGIFLRLFGIYDFSFMHDELSVIGRLHFATFSELMEKGVKPDPHPAGIQVFLWFWTKIFGISELSLRFPFILMGISCIPLMYVLTKKWFNATAALFTAGFMAVSQYTISYSVIARPYTAGLFFILILLIVWTKMVFEQDYRWKNVILFGLSAAICAYIHQFSMLTAFLIAVTGLFFMKKQNRLKYLVACLWAIALYVPHIPVILHQISAGEISASDSWLGPPNPKFILYYIKYLFHFSWIAILATATGLIIASKINKELWNNHKIKIGLALLLFITPYVIGYAYSIYVFPVLQYSGLIFSFPFLLLAAASFIDSNLNIRKIVGLLLILTSMTYSLVASRHHYQFLSSQWYEKSVTTTMEWRAQFGKEQVDCILNMTPQFADYYQDKYNMGLNNKLDRSDDDFLFMKKIENLESNYLVVAGLTDLQIEIVKQFYPVLIEYFPCFTSEIYVFAKTGEGIEGMEKIITEEYVWDTPPPAENEYIMLKECNLYEVAPSRFTKILLTMDYTCNECTEDFALVLETSYKGDIADWRCVMPGNFSIRTGDTYRIFLPFRYELLVKDSRKIINYDLKIFLWNISKTDEIIPIKCTISTFKSNPYIYAMGENIR